MAAESFRCAGIILAAGLSSRAGSEDKLLLPVDGQPMVWWAVQAATEAGLDPIVVVSAPGGDEVRGAVRDFEWTGVENGRPERGLASSLGLGVQAVAGEVDAAVILLADMPWVRRRHVQRLTAAFDPELRRAVCVPTYKGRRGNPVLWAARFFDEILALDGDRGARVVADRHPSWVHEVPMDDSAVVRDVDTLDEWRAAGGGDDTHTGGA